nr:hypothetical protein [Tanacetum cinerariifolium]
MSSLFADTHNVVAILEKSDAAEGFEQIIDFLSGNYIHYALTVNPHIYISCIKQFWNTASVKCSGDVTRLQALVDKQKIVLSEVVIHEILQLDDAKGVVCLPNEEIFAGLAQMGYEKLAKRTSWNEFSTAMASLVICLSKGQKFNFSKYIFDSLVRNVDSSSKFYMYPRFIQLIIQNQVGDLSTHTTRFISPALTQKVFANMRRVRKGFSGVETPLFEGMLAARQPAEEGVTENNKADQKLEIIKLKARVKLEMANKVKSSKLRRLRKVRASRRIESSDDMEDVFNQGRMIDDMDKDKGIELVKDDADIAETEGRHAAEQAKKQAEIYHIDLDLFSKVLSMQEDDSEVQEPSIPTAAPIVVAAYTKRIKGVIIRDPEEELSLKTLAETPKVKDKGMKKRPQTESEARKNMMIYLKNTTGYKMDFFRGMTYAEICPIFQASINETRAQKAAKRRKLSKKAQEAKDLRKRLEVVDDKDDDVFIEATPLARKVLVVDYQIVLVDNKPRFKIIKADETHQLYISFTTLLKNFNREDLENLWGIVKERFSTSKPTNFSDEYLLLTLKTMFEKPDEQDGVWKNQRSVHSLALVKSWKLLTSCGVHIITLSTVQLILLVERRYPLSRFTLE